MLNINPYKLFLAFAITGLFIALLVVAFLLSQRNAPQENASMTKETAPNFSITLFDGGNFQLSEHKGKPVLINFFASWCVPCKEEMPALEKMSREYKAKGVSFLGIAVDDSEEKARKFVEELGVSFATGHDNTGDIKEAFGLYGVPTTYFIDKEGVINYLHAGGVTERLLQHELDKLL